MTEPVQIDPGAADRLHLAALTFLETVQRVASETEDASDPEACGWVALAVQAALHNDARLTGDSDVVVAGAVRGLAVLILQQDDWRARLAEFQYLLQEQVHECAPKILGDRQQRAGAA